ncbi:MAG: methyl-accepting chemotaxis protein [Pseudomonadota bacterium]
MPHLLKSLRAKLLALLMITALIPCVAVGVVCFELSRSALQRAEIAKLGILWNAKHREVTAWFNSVVNGLTSVAESNGFRAGFEELMKPGPSPEKHSTAMKGLDEVLAGYLGRKTAEQAIEEVCLIDGKTGKILRAVKPSPGKGADGPADNAAGAGVQHVVKQVMQLKTPVISDLGAHSSGEGGGLAIGVPVFRLQTKDCIGALAIRTSFAEIDKILDISGTTGGPHRAYPVGKDFLVRSVARVPPGFVSPATGLETDAVRRAVNGRTVGTFTGPGSRGKNLTVAAPLGLNKQGDYHADFDWVMVVDVDENMAVAGVGSLAWWTAGIAGFTVLVVSMAGFFVSAGVSRPVVAMAKAARELGRGNLTVTLADFNRRDEIGTLVESFGIMINELRDRITLIRETIGDLDTSAAEMSASLSRVAENATLASGAVKETAATVEEVKRAAELAADKAAKVAHSSRQAVRITEDTRLNAEDRVRRIHVIREQMESIGEIVVLLSGQSRSVEEIITTVQDLADQSNLLAVNASIEAARAGDHGRGFAVVAQEIKLLADQSKQATGQVRAILEETRKLVSSVAVAAEQGNKAVEAGVKQSANAAESLEGLAAGVSESADAADMIEAAIGRQLAAVDRVIGSMTNLEDAVRDMKDGTGHVDHSARRPAAVGGELRRLVERYKV